MISTKIAAQQELINVLESQVIDLSTMTIEKQKNMSIDYTDVWEITILNETAEGLLVQATNGETYWMSREDYNAYLETKSKRNGQ